MKALSAIYKGQRVVELFEDIDLPKDIVVLVVIPEQEDERELRSQLRSAFDQVAVTFANNHWQGQAVDTARQLKLLLGG